MGRSGDTEEYLRTHVLNHRLDQNHPTLFMRTLTKEWAVIEIARYKQGFLRKTSIKHHSSGHLSRWVAVLSDTLYHLLASSGC